MYRWNRRNKTEGDGRYLNQNNNLTPKDKLLALKVIRECNEAKFALFKEGRSIMHIKSLEERLEIIESRESIDNLSKRIDSSDTFNGDGNDQTIGEVKK